MSLKPGSGLNSSAATTAAHVAHAKSTLERRRMERNLGGGTEGGQASEAGYLAFQRFSSAAKSGLASLLAGGLSVRAQRRAYAPFWTDSARTTFRVFG